MSKKVNVFKLHRDGDGGWGTDPHDADILKAVGTVILAIGTAIGSIIGAKKK